MKGYSTGEVAKMLSIHKSTLTGWLKKGLISEPRRNRVAGVGYRIWTERDVERVRRYKAANYRKGRGRKPKKK